MSMPKGWEEVRLGDILEYEQPTPYIVESTEYSDSNPTPVLTAGKTFILGYTDEDFGIYKAKDEPIILFDDFTTATQFVDFDFKVKSSACKILKAKNGVNIKVVFGLLQMIKYVAKDHKRHWISMFQDIKAKLPPLKEQEKIAEILSSCDEHIKNLKNLKSELEKEKLHLMNELLSGKTRFSSFTTPWQEVRLEDLALKMQSGGTPRATNKAYYGGNIPFVKISDITNSFKYLNDTEVKITELGLSNSSAWIVPKNSIIYSMYASVGFLAINTIEVATSQAMINIIPNLEKVDLNYLYYYLDDYKKYISKFIETGTQGNLNAQSVKSFTIKLPSLEEQKKIGEVLSACDERLQCLNELITAQTTLKSHLLTELLTGNLRVKDS